MDLSNINQVETVKHEIQHPDESSGVIKDEKGKSFFVEIFGKHTATYKRAFAETFTGLLEFGKDHKDDEEALELKRTESIAKFLAKISKSHHLILNGKKVSEKELESVYLDFPWLRDQLDKASSNAGAFIEKKSES